MSNGIKYLFICPDFDDMIKLKTTLEEKHGTLQCDILLNYNPKVDLTQYCLLAVDVFSISDHPMELLATLRLAAYIPIAVLVPQAQMTTESQDILFSQLYELGADFVLSLYLHDTVAGCLSAFYRRNVYYQHQKPVRQHPTMIFRDELVIEPMRRRVTLGGKAVRLTAKEYELLTYLACNSDIVVTHEVIADRVWGSGEIVNRTISSTITRLRQKIEPDPQNPTYIKAIYGTGYVFKSHDVETC